jgi:hypothetical protein
MQRSSTGQPVGHNSGHHSTQHTKDARCAVCVVVLCRSGVFGRAQDFRKRQRHLRASLIQHNPAAFQVSCTTRSVTPVAHTSTLSHVIIKKTVHMLYVSMCPSMRALTDCDDAWCLSLEPAGGGCRAGGGAIQVGLSTRSRSALAFAVCLAA